MDKKKKRPVVYLETTIISYYTNQISSVLKIAAEQQITREWWDNILPKCDPRISIYVAREVQRGDLDEAKKRTALIANIPAFTESDLVINLAKEYLKRLPIPKRAEVDAYHLAVASANETDFLLSWNCKHIANAMMYPMIKKINNTHGVGSPTICTPLELMEV